MEKQMTMEEFLAYGKEQIEMALAETDAEKKTARSNALFDAIAEARKQFMSGGATASIPVYQDPWQQKPEEKSVDPSKIETTTTGGPVAKADTSEALPWPGDMSSPAFLDGKPEPEGAWGKDPDQS